MADKQSNQSRELPGLNIKVDVDVSEALTGLKAVQREAKEATRALRELESAQPDRYLKQTTRHIRRYLVIDLGEPTNEPLSYKIYRQFNNAYLLDTLKPIE
jgi:hypothetical protein